MNQEKDWAPQRGHQLGKWIDHVSRRIIPTSSSVLELFHVCNTCTPHKEFFWVAENHPKVSLASTLLYSELPISLFSVVSTHVTQPRSPMPLSTISTSGTLEPGVWYQAPGGLYHLRPHRDTGSCIRPFSTCKNNETGGVSGLRALCGFRGLSVWAHRNVKKER